MADLILNLISLKAKADAAGIATSATNATPSLCPTKNAIPNYVTGGSSVVSISGTYDGNQLVRDANVGVGKQSGYISTHPVNNGYTYNGQNRALASAASGSGTIYYSLNGGSYSTSMPTATNAGSWTLYYYAAATSTHTQSGTYSITVSVSQAGGYVSSAPSDRGVTYNASGQTLINAGSGTGTMYYSLNGGAYSTSLPSATDIGSYTIYYYAAASTNYTQSSTGSITAHIYEPTYNGHAYRDMGQSVKWATMNLGASSPAGYGDYYRYNGSDYVSSSWGGSWKTPSYYECKDLIDNCNYGNTTYNGTACLYVTSRSTGQTIYIPFSGIRPTTSSTEGAGSLFALNTITPNGSYVYTMRGNNGPDFYISYDYLYWMPIRPVF